MTDVKAIPATHPGHYKRRKLHPVNRRCKCGTRLSVYNPREMCYTCDRR